MSEPSRFETVRWQCPHCRRTWAHWKAADDHVGHCWRNPDNRACRTCRFHQQADQGWMERPVKEACLAPEPPEGGCFPDPEQRTNLRMRCPAWEATP